MAATNLYLGLLDSLTVLSNSPFAQALYNICYGDTTRMEAINAEGGINAWITPDADKCHLIGTPLRFVVCRVWYAVGDRATIPADAYKAYVTGMNVYFYIDPTCRDVFNLTMTDAAGSTIMLESEAMVTPYKGVNIYGPGTFAGAEFEVSFIAKGAFGRLPQLFGLTFTRLTMNALSISYYVFNGVAQQGESSQKDWLSGGVAGGYSYVLLSRQTIIQPWTTEVQGAENLPVITVLTRYGTGSSMVLEDAGPVLLRTAEDVAALNALLGSDVLTYAPMCGGIAVRWINDLGGVDSYVFPLRCAKTRKVKNSSVIDLYNPDPLDVKDTIKVVNIEAGDTIKVGVDNMPRKIYETLKPLAISPSIAMYFPGVSVPANRWQAISVESCEVVESEDSDSIYYEITFRLPKINLQF